MKADKRERLPITPHCNEKFGMLGIVVPKTRHCYAVGGMLRGLLCVPSCRGVDCP